jgi:hypothetical protein
MGEIADALINGLMCEQCGIYLDGDQPGYPRCCEDCAKADPVIAEMYKNRIVKDDALID